MGYQEREARAAQERRAFRRGLWAVADPPPSPDHLGHTTPTSSDVLRAIQGYYYQPPEEPSPRRSGSGERRFRRSHHSQGDRSPQNQGNYRRGH